MVVRMISTEERSCASVLRPFSSNCFRKDVRSAAEAARVLSSTSAVITTESSTMIFSL